MKKIISIIFFATAISSVHAAQVSQNKSQSGITGKGNVTAINSPQKHVKKPRSKKSEFLKERVLQFKEIEFIKKELNRRGLEKFVNEYIDFGFGGLLPNHKYNLSDLANLKCVHFGVVQLNDVADKQYQFADAIELLIRLGGPAVFKSGQELFLEDLKHVRQLERERVEKEKDFQDQLKLADKAQQDRLEADKVKLDRAKQDRLEENKVKLDRAKRDRAEQDLQQQQLIFENQLKIDANRYELKNALWKKLLKDGAISLQIQKTIALISSMIVFILLFRHWISKKALPELVIDTNMSAWDFSEFGLFAKRPKLKDRKIVLRKGLEAKKTALINRIKEAIKDPSKGIPHLIFKGPPGVGKTSTAIDIIEKSGCFYVKIDGSRLLQWQPHQAIEEANKLIRRLVSIGKPVYLIIDEGDVLFSKRNNNKDVSKVLTPFLALISDTSGILGIIILTNLYDELDEAVISRVLDMHIWTFEAPLPSECTTIACDYLNSYRAKLGLRRGPDLYQRWVREKIYLAMEAREGQISGRDIRGIAEEAVLAALINPKNKYTDLDWFLKFLEELKKKKKKKK